MKIAFRSLFLIFPALMLSACANAPQLFWSTEDGSSDKPAYARGSAGTASAPSRAALEVPPELRAEMELPGDARVASESGNENVPAAYREAVAGKAVALDARVYDIVASKVFSAVVDAMTSLNLPVDSVDSPSGIITTDWVRKGSNSSNVLAGLTGQTSNLTRHRFIVRTYRLKGEADQPAMSRLEVRVLAQAYRANHWVNVPLKRKVSEELFTAVDEQLTRMQKEVAPQAAEPQPLQ